ncbi:MAG: CAF17-like 4Fe-4S cluster assembly/insertion protein YgfZ [Alphaproteobacteria bacterium]|jgi:folate-binding protein YgfZ
MKQTSVVLARRGLIKVTGVDRVEFLQGLVSNDIEKVSPARAVWAALLTPQGKYLHDFFVVAIGEAIYLDCEADRLVDLGQRLRRYVLRAQVALDVENDFAVMALFGENAATRLDLPEEPGAARMSADGGAVYVDPRLAAAGARAIAPVGTSQFSEEFQVGSTEDYDTMRLSLGLSDGSRDLIVEKSILLESNFDELHGVDWEKGCFMGQELTARTKYRGLVKKRLLPIRIEGDAPKNGAPILDGAREIGEIRSTFNGLGMAIIRLDALEKAPESRTLQSDGATITPWKPDWIRL